MGLYEAVKDAANVARKADNIELYQKILDLQAQALDEQEAKAALTTRVRELEQRLEMLEKDLRFSKSLKLDARVQAYLVADEGESAGAHICSRCWDTRRIGVRMRDYNNGFWGCPECNSSVNVDSRGRL